MDVLAKIKAEMLPFATLLGIEFTGAATDRVTAEMVVRDDLCTRPAILHGGASEGAGTATLESKTNFIAGAPAGTRVIGEAMPIHRGRTTRVWQTRVTTAEGRLVAVVGFPVA
jgi:acyl-coenzyme A thioesterase PaaI-like protein